MAGGNGNDTYVVDNAGDIAMEAPAAAPTRCRAPSPSRSPHDVETLALNGAAAIDGTGKACANTIYGNSAANRLDGNGGNDTLTGFGGADVFVFDDGDGADTVTDFRTAATHATLPPSPGSTSSPTSR